MNNIYRQYLKRLFFLLPLILLIASPCAAKGMLKSHLLDVPASQLLEQQQNKDRVCSGTSYSEVENLRFAKVQVSSSGDNDFLHPLADSLAQHWLMSVAFDTDAYQYRYANADAGKLPQPFYILYRQLLLYS